MIKLKAHNKILGRYNEIDRFLLVPKKMWENVPEGKISIVLKGQKLKARVYDILCDCVKPDHHHRIIDLRDVWDKLEIKEGDNISVEND